MMRNKISGSSLHRNQGFARKYSWLFNCRAALLANSLAEHYHPAWRGTAAHNVSTCSCQMFYSSNRRLFSLRFPDARPQLCRRAFPSARLCIPKRPALATSRAIFLSSLLCRRHTLPLSPNRTTAHLHPPT